MGRGFGKGDVREVERVLKGRIPLRQKCQMEEFLLAKTANKELRRLGDSLAALARVVRVTARDLAETREWVRIALKTLLLIQIPDSSYEST